LDAIVINSFYSILVSVSELGQELKYLIRMIKISSDHATLFRS